MRSPVLMGAGAGVLVVLVALLVGVTLLAGAPLRLGDRVAGAAAGAAETGISGPTPAGGAAPAADPPAGTASPGASATAAPSARAPRVGTAVGDLAPPLALPRLGGGTIDLAGLRGRPVWVNFMASWCPPCRAELPLMQGYQTELGRRLTIVLVDVRESEPTVSSFASSLGITLPTGLDTAGRAQTAWGAYALPVHYWIDASGVVRAVAFGSLGPAQFQANVRQVLPGVQLRP